MVRNPYEWAPGEPPPPIRQHSIVKHEILHAYLVAYLRTLVASPKQDVFRLTLVDGFAGGGIYRHERSGQEILGSPFKMLEAVQEAEFLINQDRVKPVVLDVDFVFTEPHKGAFEVLNGLLVESEYAGRIDEGIFLRQSRFEEEAEAIVARVRAKSPKAGRVIFLLDQYGYKDVPASLIRSLLSQLPGAEVILTFAVDSFLNFITDDQRTRAPSGTGGELRGAVLHHVLRPL